MTTKSMVLGPCNSTASQFEDLELEIEEMQMEYHKEPDVMKFEPKVKLINKEYVA